MAKTYYIIPIEEITDDMIKESLNDDYTIRESRDGELAILKFNKRFPNSMIGKRKLSHSEILDIIKNNVDTWGVQ